MLRLKLRCLLILIVAPLSVPAYVNALPLRFNELLERSAPILPIPSGGEGTSHVVSSHSLIYSETTQYGSLKLFTDMFQTTVNDVTRSFYSPGGAGNYSHEFDGRILSFIGPYFTIRADNLYVNDVETDRGRRIDYRTLRLDGDVYQVMSLLDFFSSQDIRDGIAANKNIQRLLRSARQGSPANTLTGLLTQLSKVEDVSRHRLGALNPGCIWVIQGESSIRPFLTRFAFHSLSKSSNKVRVRMAFDVHNDALCRKLVVFDIYL
jgi:hypothetical protein